MKKHICDFCKRESSDSVEVSDSFAKYVPSSYRDMCSNCEKSIDDYLANRKREYLTRAWEETAKFAQSITQDDHL